MTKSVWIRLGVLVFIVALTVGSVTYTTRATGDFDGAHWARTGNPFNLKVGDNVSGRWDKYLKKATSQWNKPGVARMQIVAGDSAAGQCRPNNGRVEVCSDNYGKKGWLGLTKVWVDNKDHILRATVQMNDSYFKRGKYDKDSAKRHTICHELGHSLGLEHNKRKSCLNDSDTSVFRDTNPSKGDYKDLKRLYRHKDSRNEVNAALAPAGPVEEIAIPDQPERGAQSGGLGTYETVHTEATGDGGRVITFVTWVQE